MKLFWSALGAGMMLAVGSPAGADVKAGVDAWQQGDYAKAIGEWRPLAQAGDADAQFNLGQAYKLGRGVQSDLNAALDWYRKAAAQGHLRAEDNLGLILFQQGDRAGAMSYLQRSAARGEPRAQYIVATALFNGDMISKDWVRAYALMTRAAASGLPQATTSLQQMDKYVPEDQRKQGLSLAANLEQQQQQRKDSAVAMAAPAPAPLPARGQPSQVRTAELPPSTIPQPARPVPATPNPAPEPAKPVAKPAAPKPVLASRPAPAPAASGGWRIQLGAFSEEGRARTLWKQLTGKVGGLSAYQPYLVKAGTVTRLQAGPVASAADAARLCGAIKSAGSDCMPRKM